MKDAAIFIIGLMTLMLATGVLAQQPETTTVRPLRERLVIRGTTTFPAVQVAKQVIRNFDVLLATHPAADRFELAPIIRRKIVAGYLNRGFHQVKVEVAEDAKGQITVTVDEGPRFLEGSIRIEGARRISVERLRKRLTSRNPPDNAVAPRFHGENTEQDVSWVDKDGNLVRLNVPLWKSGRPATFDQPTLEYMRRRIRKAFGDLGFPFANLQIVIKPAANGLAELVVSIADEGPEAVVSEILIEGNLRNSRQDILDHLRIQPNMVLTERKRLQISHALWKSGRFIDSKVRALESFSRDDPIKLKITVVEYDRASRLSEPLTAAEQAMLKLRQRAVSIHENTDEFVFKAGNADNLLQLVVAPANGILARYSATDSKDSSKTDYAFVMSQSAFGLYSTVHPKKLVIPTDSATLVLWLSLNLTDPKKDPDKLQRVSFGVGYNSDAKDRLRLTLDFAPAFFLALAHEHTRKLPVTPTIKNSVVTSESKNARIRVDAKSGRLVEFSLFRSDTKDSGGHLYVKQGEFDRIMRQLNDSTADRPNAFDRRRPYSSFIAFFLEPVFLRAILKKHFPNNSRTVDLEAVAVLRQLLDSGMLAPIDDWSTSKKDSGNKETSDKRNRFRIPVDSKLFANSGGANFMTAMGRSAVPLADRFFQPRAWPWTVWRETAFTIAGQPKYTEAELKRLYRCDDCGPVCCLVLSNLLRFRSRAAAFTFAKRGLQVLDAEHFSRDYRPLLDKTSLVGQTLIRMASQIRGLDRDDSKQLSHLVSDEMEPVLSEFVRELRKTNALLPDRSASDALDAAFERSWSAGLDKVIERLLQESRDRNDPQIQTAARPTGR